MLSTSLDGQWTIVRRGREVVLLAGGAAPPVGRLELEDDDVDLALVGPPTVLAAVSRGAGGAKVVLHQPPYLDAVARLDLDAPMKLAAVTGPRLVLVSPDGKTVQIVRAAGRALASQALDVGSPVEFAVGLERNQVLFGLMRKLEVWDAVSARPLLRLQLQLPPPPRTVGAAHGHLWVTRPGSDEVFVYRLSDGRPFRHYVGATVEEVVCHPASPLIVLVTPRGLVRLHCFAHSLTVVDTPWTPGTPLALLAAGDDVSLLGISDGEDEPWRVPVGGAGAPVAADDSNVAAEPVLANAADKLRAMRERAAAPVEAQEARVAPVVSSHAASGPRARVWREPLAAYGLELVRGVESELPIVPVDSELGELAHRLGLPSGARRALVALYSLHLVGEPMLSIARLAHALADWTEPLGQGELGALAMLRRRDGKLGLRAAVTDLIDGLAPRSIRVVGGAAAAPRAGVSRLSRDGRSDAAIETELATQLGRVAVLMGGAPIGVLEARLHGATALALAAPHARPQPWPRDAGLIIVADPAAPGWVTALPSY
ncbi:MAG: hypothetical protein JWP01_4049 [Myxococcales bacterium]|nr:hypothetical protein [Myxococcales bacterium]